MLRRMSGPWRASKVLPRKHSGHDRWRTGMVSTERLPCQKSTTVSLVYMAVGPLAFITNVREPKRG